MPLQATSGAASYDAFGGGVVAEPNYIESCFSTYLYTGTGATNNIVNGIDLAGKGGLVWTKARTTTSAFTFAHALMDTLRGAGIQICSDRTDANTTQANSLTSFNSDGYTLGADTGQGRVNNSSYGTQTYVGWTFRKQPKFFDVVTYTGNGTAGRTVAHSLGSVPGCMIVKRTDASNGWAVYHRSMNASPQDYMMRLNATTEAFTTSPSRWNNTLPTSTEFTLSGNDEVNGSGATYVAYLFAHDAGGFGLTGTDNVISCGSFTFAYPGPTTINLGYEPQWILYKNVNDVDNWTVIDNMRGMTVGGADAYLRPNTSQAEGSFDFITPTSTGFVVNDGVYGSNYIYIAIRRGPMKVPTDATKVYAPIAYAGNDVANRVITGLINTPDWVLYSSRNAAGQGNHFVGSRLQGGGKYLLTESTSAESSSTSYGIQTYGQTSVTLGSAITNEQNAIGINYILYGLERAPSFFDVVCYTGNSTSGATQTHNLGVVPELMIVKGRSVNANWFAYTQTLGATKYLILNDTGGAGTLSSVWNDTAPTSTTFTLGNAGAVNSSGGTYVAYLFATCAGVSKVFSYTGNGSSQTINCGFTGGARWILIKRTDSTGDWYVWDSARGIVSGNDPHLSLNTTAAEVTSDDTIDTDSTGFVVNQVSATNVNVSSATYIGIAIA